MKDQILFCLCNYSINNESKVKEVYPYSNKDHMYYLSLSVTIFISQPPTLVGGNNASIDKVFIVNVVKHFVPNPKTWSHLELS